MTHDIANVSLSFGKSSQESIQKLTELENELLKLPQTEVSTKHLIHAGMYARTICIKAGTLLTGAQIKINTILIFNGNATVYNDGDAVDLIGYHVIPASAGRKQAFMAHEDTWLTMIFPSNTKSVQGAEEEFTDEHHRLMSRSGTNHISITGE